MRRAWYNSTRRGAARPAYSMIELVLAMAVLAVLLLGAQSAVLLSSKALP